MKLTHIVLSDGAHPSQPMLTRHSSGALQDAMAEAQRIAADLKAQGADVLRVKIEIDADNSFAPADQREALSRPGHCYFEHHVKLLLPASRNNTDIRTLAQRHGAQLSRNVLRIREDGMEERFLTQRVYAQGRAFSARALQDLKEELNRQSFSVLESEAEYVVFDSNVDLDAGWISIL